MKILTFVDIHTSKKAMEKIKEKAKNADLLVCAGDVSIFGQGLNEGLKELNGLGKPIVIIHGNHESEKEMRDAIKPFKNFIFLHGEAMEVDDLTFLGYGGGGFSLVDKNFEKFGKIFEKRIENRKVVLLTHAPPYKTNLDKINGEYAGNKSIRQFIEKHSPVLAVSGHLHENSEKEDKIGETIVVNPGPFGKIFDI
ncbi:MAG: metallophosphoesterase [Candidatus Woesearchaeota archaeon]